MRINKIKKYILIPVICIILSVFISIVSFADSPTITYSFALQGLAHGFSSNTISSDKPSFYYGSSSYRHVDLSDGFTDLAKYGHFYISSSSNPSGNSALVIIQNFYISDNGFYTQFVFPSIDTEYAIVLSLFRNNESTRFYYHDFANLGPTGTYSDEYISTSWRYSTYVYDDALDNKQFTVNAVSFAGFTVNTSSENTPIKCEMSFDCRVENADVIQEFIVPVFPVNNGSPPISESSDESSDSGNINSTLDEMQEQLDDVITGLGGIQDEVSQLGDDISQGFADLNSAEESRHNEIMGDDYSTDQSGIDNMGLQVSELDNNFSDHDIDISNGIDNLNSFDESDLFDDIESAFNDLDNAAGHNDMHYTSFVQQFYSTLGIGTYLLFLVPFCMIFVLFKFVLGGVV